MVVSNGAPTRPASRPAAARRAGTSRRRRSCPPTSPRSSAGPYHVVTQRPRRHPARPVLPPVAGRVPRPRRDLRRHQAGLRLLPRGFGLRYPFGKYDQLFVPEFNAGAMENAGCVTFLEDYVFRSKVTDAPGERRGRHDPARDGAHVVRRPRHHALVGRPVAQRVVRRLGRAAGPGRGDPLDRRLDHLRQPQKTWAYRQDQLPSTHPIAADAPDMEAVEINFDGITYAKGASVLKQLVAWVGRDEFLAGLRALLQRARLGQHHPGRPARRAGAASGRDLAGWSKEWLETAGVNTLRPAFELDGDGRFTAFDVVQERARQPPDAALAPARDRPVRPDRRGAGPAAPGRARRRGRAHRGARAGRRAPARPAAAQRRRPDLRQDPAGRALAGARSSPASASSPSRCPPRCAGPPPGT